MVSPTIRSLLSQLEPQTNITVQGWVRTRRDSKTCTFFELHDGSSLKGIQVVADLSLDSAELYPQILTGASIKVEGDLVASPGAKQAFEILAKKVSILGKADASYPLQKKGHTPEFLRSISHLRPRTNLLGSVFRVRSRMAFAIHQFFQERDFHYIHTPIITSSDCEGAGEMFRVSTLPQGSKAPATEDFFGKPTFLTVSGQLQGEAFACAMGKIYTFGPTFRAENSNTTRHAAEFWMIEPEMAFHELTDDMNLAEENLKYLLKRLFETCPEELEFFNKFVDKDLIHRLQKTLEKDFQRVTYTEAVDQLLKSGKSFQFPVAWGQNLQSEHERFLAEEYFDGPVTVYNYPRSLKPFYMKQNEDGETVGAMDVLVPGIGEIIGGSQREDDFIKLENAMEHHGLNPETYSWYTDLRRYGSVPHAGYGMGFERFLMYATGVNNIRDVIPFARTPGHADF